MRKILKCGLIYKKDENTIEYENKGIGSNKFNHLLKKRHIVEKKKLLERIHVTLSISMSTNGKTSHKSIANVARTIAMSITNFLKGLMLLCKIRLWKRSWDSTLWVLLCHCICVILKG
jgi:hypothetical protein